MTIKSLFTLTPILFTGMFALHLLWQKKSFNALLLKVFLGSGMGLGINSLFFFIYLLLFGKHNGYFFVQLLLASGLGTAIIFLEWKKGFPPGWHYKLNKKDFFSFTLLLAFFSIAFFIFFTIVTRRTHGAWDTWAMYNRTARFIYRGNTFWQDAFSPELVWYFHPDYPPLVALNIAAGWSALKQETVRVPMLISGIFLFASLGSLAAIIRKEKTTLQAVLAAGGLMSASGYLNIGSMQLADIPLAFFMLGAAIFLTLHESETDARFIFLAGLFTGLAGWTKNEGIIFIPVISIALLLTYKNQYISILRPYLFGLLIPLAVLVFFKINLAPSGDLFVSLPKQSAYIFQGERHKLIFDSFWRDIKSWGNWLLLFIYVILFGISRKQLRNPAIKFAILTFIGQLFGYYCIFLITPYDLSWHLLASSRVLLQIAPLFFFIFFNLTNPPEEKLFRSTSQSAPYSNSNSNSSSSENSPILSI